MPLTRRTFLSTTAGLTTASLLSGAEPKATAMLPVIDTHVHLWDLQQFKLPWITPGSPSDRNFTLADFTAATADCHVVKGVYMEVDVAPEQKQAEADWISKLCAQPGSLLVGAVVGGRVADAGFPTYAQQFKGSKYVKGIRQVLHAGNTPAGFSLGAPVVKHLQLLGELGLTFDLCMRSAELPDATKLATLCPNTRFILDHCGNPSVQSDLTQWKRDLAALAQRSNVVCKLSGIIESSSVGKWTPDDLAPIVNHCLDSFGPTRVVFAANWPVCNKGGTFKDWLTALRSIIASRPLEQQKQLLHDNALRVYGLA
jgi:predicted TIM-barrel fold metal-dependent hydrolase